MATEDQFPKAPPIRFKLTKAQARAIEEAKPAGSAVLVCGYAQRHPWPDPDKFTLCAWFVDSAAAEEALKGAGIMAKKRPQKRRKAKPLSDGTQAEKTAQSATPHAKNGILAPEDMPKPIMG